MKGLLSKIEIIIGGVILLLFLMWTSTRCNEKKAQLQEEAMVQAVEDSVANAQKLTPKKTASDNTLEEALRKRKAELAAAAAKVKADSTKKSEVATAPAKATTPIYNKLYVTIDKLKLRSEAGLDSEVLGELPLFSEVYFLDEVTDTTYVFNLGKEVADEPYVKVENDAGNDRLGIWRRGKLL